MYIFQIFGFLWGCLNGESQGALGARLSWARVSRCVANLCFGQSGRGGGFRGCILIGMRFCFFPRSRAGFGTPNAFMAGDASRSIHADCSILL